MDTSLRNAPGPASFLKGVKSWVHRWSGVENVRQASGSAVGVADAFSLNGRLRVLVVDDNPSHLEMASEVLEQCGISALLASDGAEAVLLACERRFDIILMDLQMPVMDGLKATTTIRRFEEMNSRLRTPVVAFSTSEVSQTLLAASGMDGRLNKPCSTTELEACMLHWCDGFQPWSASLDIRAGVARVSRVNRASQV